METTRRSPHSSSDPSRIMIFIIPRGTIAPDMVFVKVTYGCPDSLSSALEKLIEGDIPQERLETFLCYIEMGLSIKKSGR